MILKIRLFLIFLLVLLQCAAPLIHAHTKSVAYLGASVHLPEFEQVNSLLKHAPQFIAQTNHEGEIVAISAGIKNKKNQFLQAENTIFSLFVSVFVITKIQQSLTCFSLQTELIPKRLFFNLASPRAPPFFYTC